MIDKAQISSNSNCNIPWSWSFIMKVTSCNKKRNYAEYECGYSSLPKDMTDVRNRKNMSLITCDFFETWRDYRLNDIIVVTPKFPILWRQDKQVRLIRAFLRYNLETDSTTYQWNKLFCVIDGKKKHNSVIVTIEFDVMSA
jgi:hypothetical protein